MPPGYNPSDDSEDEYTPVAKKAKRKDDSDFDSDEESRPKKLRRGRKPKFDSSIPTESSKPSTSNPVETYQQQPNIKSEPGQEEDMLACVLCNETLKLDINARFHYSKHYYDSNAFLDILKPEDLKDGKAQDEIGRVFKYTCPHNGCTKRKMGYKEICVHLATAHQQLRELMASDNRPGIKQVLDRLYPQVEVFPAVRVKQEKGVEQEKGVDISINIPRREAIDTDNSEDVDDPTVESNPAPHKVPARKRVKAEAKIKIEGGAFSLAPRCDKVHHCLICNGPGKSNKDGRNLNLGSGLPELKYHYSVCVYNEGGFRNLIDSGQGSVEFEDLEIFGAKFRYKCPFQDCPKNQGRSKPIGFKEYAIHCGVAHHQVEKVLVNDPRPGIKEVCDIMRRARELEDIELEDMPDVIVEVMHTCLICQGEDKEGKNLSFDPDKIYSTRYHYASCYYDQGVYVAMYPPGAQNTNEEGGPRDVLGREVKYSCQERGCTVKRKMGYKEFTIHMANEHEGLEECMKADHREEVRNLAGKMKKK